MIKSLILFDIDGTLAESSKKVEDRMLLKLSFMKGDNYDYGLISGGKYEKIVDQVGINFLLPNKGQMFDSIVSVLWFFGFNEIWVLQYDSRHAGRFGHSRCRSDLPRRRESSVFIT